MKLGAQFYSIRTKTTTPEDLKASFKAMKEVGYDNAQMSAICKMDPYVLKSYVDEYDLPIVCTHSPFDRIVNDTDELIKEHKIYGCPVIGLGAMGGEYRGSLENLKKFLEVMEAPIKKIRDAGLYFSYHNHAFEFEITDGVLPYDYMIENCPEMTFILDTYWVKYGGYDYLEYIKKLGSERITNVHFKDMKEETKGPICACGEGVINFKPVIELCDSIGIESALVEQDNAPDFGNPWDQMALSFKNIKPLF